MGTVLIFIALKVDRTSHGENVLADNIDRRREHRRWEAWDGAHRAGASASPGAQASKAPPRDYRAEGFEAATTVAIAEVAAEGTVDYERLDSLVTSSVLISLAASREVMRVLLP